MSDNDTTGAPGFNEITKEYKASPTIENYVRLRRKYPDEPIDVGMTGGFEFLCSQAEELRSQRIGPDLVAGVMDACPSCQSKLSLLLLELLIERRKKESDGETHIVSRGKAIGDTLVNYLIAISLEALDPNYGAEISPDLIVLIKHQLGSTSSNYEIETEKREKRSQALFIAAQMAVNGEIPSYRKLGRILGVQASTVKRWFPNDTFISEAKALAEEFRNSRISENLESVDREKE